MRRRASAIAGALLAATLVAGTVAVMVAGAAGGAGAIVGTGELYTDSAGWSFTYPATLRLEHSAAASLASFSEVTVANFSQTRAVHSGPTPDGFFIRVDPPLDASGQFPNTGVAFRMELVVGGPAPDVAVPDSRFPISLGTFIRRGSYYRQLPTVPLPWQRPVDADGEHYTALAWIGRDASPGQVRALEAVITSLSFPRLHPGTVVGYGLSVLQPANRFPVGSFRVVYVTDGHSHTAPFYLVHAPGRLSRASGQISPCFAEAGCTPPGAFYALGWTMNDPPGGYASRCDLRLDARREQFYCTNSTARWDRVGRVLRRARDARLADPLQFAFAKIAWDGHVVVDYGVSEHPTPSAVRSLWPGWPGLG